MAHSQEPDTTSQTWFSEQVTPHAPQLSALIGVHAPLQSTVPAAQLGGTDPPPVPRLPPVWPEPPRLEPPPAPREFPPPRLEPPPAADEVAPPVLPPVFESSSPEQAPIAATAPMLASKRPNDLTILMNSLRRSLCAASKKQEVLGILQSVSLIRSVPLSKSGAPSHVARASSMALQGLAPSAGGFCHSDDAQ